MITLEMQTKFSAGRQTHSCRILFGTNADRANMEQAVGMQPAVGWNLQTRDRAMRSKDSEGFPSDSDVSCVRSQNPELEEEPQEQQLW